MKKKEAWSKDKVRVRGEGESGGEAGQALGAAGREKHAGGGRAWRELKEHRGKGGKKAVKREGSGRGPRGGKGEAGDKGIVDSVSRRRRQVGLPR